MISNRNKIALVIGAGSHARVVLSVLEENRDYEEIVIYSETVLHVGEKIFGIPVCNSSELLSELEAKADAYIAIGNNIEREKWYDTLSKMNYSMPNLIAHSAILNAHAILGCANVICHKAFLGPEVFIENNNLINTSSLLEHGVTIGSNNHFAPGAIILGNSSIGDSNFFGGHSVVREKTNIGDRVVIGAGAVVVDDINDPGAIYIGNPARKMKRAVL